MNGSFEIRIRSMCVALAALVVLVSTNVWAQQDTQRIRIASLDAITTLDPARSATAGNIEALGQLYSKLFRYNATKDKVVPALAKSWDVSDDGLTITINLRKAGFSDGTPITAEDVAFSLLRVRYGKMSVYKATVAFIDDVVAKDDDTVVLKLKYPYAAAIANLTAFNTGIVSKDAVKGNKHAFDSDPVTSGPYEVHKWVVNDKLVLDPNPYYWRKGYPKNDGAVLLEVPNPQTRIAMLRTGEIQASRRVPWSRIDELKALDNIEVPLNPSTIVFDVLLNNARPPFDNVLVRRAAALALNRKVITKAATFGYGEVANTTLSDEIKFHYDDYPGIPYDPAKARALLAKAGGVDKPVVIMIHAGNSLAQKVATLMQSYWQAVGLKASIQKLDAATWAGRAIGGDYTAALVWYYNETRDPDLAVRWAVCGACGPSFFTHYNNDKVNKLVEKAAAAYDDSAKREKMYHEIQAISTHEVAQIPLFYLPYNNAYNTEVEGLRMTPFLQWTLARAHFVD